MPTEIVQMMEVGRSESPSRMLRERRSLLESLTAPENAIGRTRPPHPFLRRLTTDSATPPDLPELLSFTPSEFQVVLQQLRAFQDEFSNDTSTRQPLPDIRIPLTSPPPCSFLRPGQTFVGWQRVTHHWGKGEQWQVSVTLHGLDQESGQICGVMRAQDVPEAAEPVITYFEGEIIDNKNFSFYTSHTDWSALSDTDIRHWSKFPVFRDLKKDVETWGGRAASLADCSKIFMRWKEQYFITGCGECRLTTARLTIAGFYYCCLDRATGSIQAIYYDPASNPDQRLNLEACSGGECGHAFATHELA